MTAFTIQVADVWTPVEGNHPGRLDGWADLGGDRRTPSRSSLYGGPSAGRGTVFPDRDAALAALSRAVLEDALADEIIGYKPSEAAQSGQLGRGHGMSADKIREDTDRLLAEMRENTPALVAAAKTQRERQEAIQDRIVAAAEQSVKDGAELVDQVVRLKLEVRAAAKHVANVGHWLSQIAGATQYLAASQYHGRPAYSGGDIMEWLNAMAGVDDEEAAS